MANIYLSITGKTKNFFRHEKAKSKKEPGVLSDKLKEFSEQRERMNRNCPQPPKWAYRKAKKGIEESESDYKVDQEEQAV